jgi:hypothetical protein
MHWLAAEPSREPRRVFLFAEAEYAVPFLLPNNGVIVT